MSRQPQSPAEELLLMFKIGWRASHLACRAYLDLRGVALDSHFDALEFAARKYSCAQIAEAVEQIEGRDRDRHLRKLRRTLWRAALDWMGFRERLDQGK